MCLINAPGTLFNIFLCVGSAVYYDLWTIVKFDKWTAVATVDLI
jgi:hypothetical protein